MTINPVAGLDRREFLASLGAMSAAGRIDPARFGAPRGLARASDDFMLAPGLAYLQTGSMGPTPRPVMERVIAAWKEHEVDPVYYGYGSQENAMDDVRAKAALFLAFCRLTTGRSASPRH